MTNFKHEKMTPSCELNSVTDKVAMELEDMTLSYRHLEHVKRQLMEETESETRKSTWTIEKFVVENTRLKRELSELREFGGSDFKDMRVLALKAAAMDEQLDAMEAAVVTETEKGADLSKQTSSLEASTEQLLSEITAAGGVVGDKSANVVLQSRLAILETKLTRSLSQFGKVATANRDIRESCDTLRFECDALSKLTTKLRAELDERERSASAIVERANKCFDVRDRVQTKLCFLRQIFDKERAEFDTEMRELSALIENSKCFSSLVRAGREMKGTSRSDARKDSVKEAKVASNHGLLVENTDSTQSRDYSADSTDSSTSSASKSVGVMTEELCELLEWSGLEDGLEKFKALFHGNFGMYITLRELDRTISELKSSGTDSLRTDEIIVKDAADETKKCAMLRSTLDSVQSAIADLAKKESSIESRLGEACAKIESIARDRQIFPKGWSADSKVQSANVTGVVGALEAATNYVLVSYMQEGGRLDYPDAVLHRRKSKETTAIIQEVPESPPTSPSSKGAPRDSSAKPRLSTLKGRLGLPVSPSARVKPKLR